MTGRIDWEALAGQLGLIERDAEGGLGESGGSDEARLALERILGEAEMRAAVDHYVALRPGSELARSVLWLLHPGSAMLRCREIANDATDPEERRTAVELLRVVADRRALPWISDYLDDRDEGIQFWAIGILDQLLRSELIEPEEAEGLLQIADRHPNAQVREQAQFIRGFLADRVTTE